MRASARPCCCPPTLPCGWFRCCRRSVDAGYLRLEVIAGPARCVQTARVLTHLAVPHRWHSQAVDAGGKVEACGSVSWSSRVGTWFAFLLSMIQLVMAVLRLNHFNFEVDGCQAIDGLVEIREVSRTRSSKHPPLPPAYRRDPLSIHCRLRRSYCLQERALFRAKIAHMGCRRRIEGLNRIVGARL